VDIESDRVSEERRVHIACLDCPPVLHPGEQAEALIALTRLPEAVLIPRTALSGSQGGGGLAWAVVEGRLAKVPLTFGHATHDGRLEVVRGLPEGALLATKPDAGFKEGRRARAVDPP
ncbi:MAG: efflux RND transporter periplasmic adaptor subunit, partial [Alphaproteobacteria bacterium]|nr:efflux RND transporter periplasmic adaptor subunit [Alphaproteobacteria bacterium]